MTLKVTYNNLTKEVFENLFKTHFQYLCNFAQNYISDSDTSKEIVQDVFIKLWENNTKVDINKSIKSYLFTSVKNRCLNYIRDNKKFRSNILDVDIADYDISFEEKEDSSEIENKVKSSLEKLPEKCRQVFELSRFENLKYREIAEKLKISQKTVEAQMSKALKIFREDFKDYIKLLIIYFVIK